MKSMDPSNFGSFSSGGNSGATGNAGVSNGGVASGTNPAANPQQVNPVQTQGFGGAQQMGQVYQPTSVFQQPQPSQFRQSQQFSTQPPVISNDSIILSPDNTKSKKKSILITVIIVGGLILVATLFFIFKPWDNSSVLRTQNSLNLSVQAYTNYANYLIYGINDNNPINDEVVWETQSILRDVADSSSLEERSQYVDELSELYNRFSEQFDNANFIAENEEDNELLYSLYESNSSGVRSLVNYFKAGRLSSNEIAKEYLKSGKDNVLDLVESTYQLDSNQSDAYSRFVTAKRLEAQRISSVYDYYSGVGCISGEVLQEECVELHANDDELLELVNLANEAVENSEVLSLHLVSDVISTSSEFYLTLRELL